MGRKVAIIGMSPSAMDSPIKDDSWECWCLAWDLARARLADRTFEIHDRQDWSAYYRVNAVRKRYEEHLRELERPIYMQKVFEDIPASVAYPIHEVIEESGRDYFGSSIAYMLALAWWERESHRLEYDPRCKITEVGIWGVELSESDYHHQRPNIEYWIGRIEEQGVPVRVECPRGMVMKLHQHKQRNGKVYSRYGWIVDEEATNNPPKLVAPWSPPGSKPPETKVQYG